MSAAPAIPVLDLSPLLQPKRDAESVERLTVQLDRACRDIGFFYITGFHNHGGAEGTAAAPLLTPTPTLHHRFPVYVRRFFALPQSSKDTLDSSTSPAAHGCAQQGRSSVAQTIATAGGAHTHPPLSCFSADTTACCMVSTTVHPRMGARTPRCVVQCGVVWREMLCPPTRAALPPLPQESYVLGVEREAGDPRPATPMMGDNQWPREEELPGA